MVESDSRLKVLVLFPKLYWERKMSIVRRDVIRAMLSGVCGVEAKLSGQGWPNWDVDASLVHNVDRLMPDADCVFWYKPLGNGKEGIPEIRGRDSVAIPRVEAFNEAWWPEQRAVRETEQAKTTHVVHHHENDAQQFESFGGSVRHIPHCASYELFGLGRRPVTQRKTSVIVTGALSADIYPLRTHVADLIRRGRLPGLVRTHPGYRLRSVMECDRQRSEYADALRASQVSVCCSSKYRYALAKAFESWMAGCVVVGEMPDDSVYREAFGAWHVEASERTAERVIRDLLRDPGEMMRRAGGGSEVASRAFTVESYVRKFVEFLRE